MMRRAAHTARPSFRLNNPAQVYRKSGQSETMNPAKRNRPFSIENGCAVLGTRELPFLEWQLPFA